MPKILKPKEKRTIIVRVLTNEAENKAIRAAAKREGMNVAEFMRHLAESYISGKAGHK